MDSVDFCLVGSASNRSRCNQMTACTIPLPLLCGRYPIRSRLQVNKNSNQTNPANFLSHATRCRRNRLHLRCHPTDATKQHQPYWYVIYMPVTIPCFLVPILTCCLLLTFSHRFWSVLERRTPCYFSCWNLVLTPPHWSPWAKKLKQIACALMLYKGPESAAAAGALLVCPYQNNCYNALFLLYVIRFFGLFISSFYYADDDALIEGFSEGG